MLSQATVQDVRSLYFLKLSIKLMYFFFIFSQIPQPNFFEEILKRNNSAEYDFHLEREVLCTTKSENSRNPFFH